MLQWPHFHLQHPVLHFVLRAGLGLHNIYTMNYHSCNKRLDNLQRLNLHVIWIYLSIWDYSILVYNTIHLYVILISYDSFWKKSFSYLIIKDLRLLQSALLYHSLSSFCNISLFNWGRQQIIYTRTTKILFKYINVIISVL